MNCLSGGTIAGVSADCLDPWTGIERGFFFGSDCNASLHPKSKANEAMTGNAAAFCTNLRLSNIWINMSRRVYFITSHSHSAHDRPVVSWSKQAIALIERSGRNGSMSVMAIFRQSAGCHQRIGQAPAN